MNVLQHGVHIRIFLWTTRKQNRFEPGDLPVLTAAKGWDAEGLSAAATGSCGQREWSTQCCSLTSKVFVLFPKGVRGCHVVVRKGCEMNQEIMTEVEWRLSQDNTAMATPKLSLDTPNQWQESHINHFPRLTSMIATPQLNNLGALWPVMAFEVEHAMASAQSRLASIQSCAASAARELQRCQAEELQIAEELEEREILDLSFRFFWMKVTCFD